jgi:hypothetical protein
MNTNAASRQIQKLLSARQFSVLLTNNRISRREGGFGECLCHIPDNTQNQSETVLQVFENMKRPSQYQHQRVALARENNQSCSVHLFEYGKSAGNLMDENLSRERRKIRRI